MAAKNIDLFEKIYLVPEVGQLVEVRRRQWVVTQVDAGGMNANFNKIQHLVSMESIDEDSIGEELQVIWEIEPGARVLEKAGLPTITGYDSNNKLNAFLDAVRWGAASNAERQFLQAPFRSGITIEDYQLDPLVRAIDMARVNLLIADDVGLGKTIEAGLVIHELLIRHRARTVWVVCPSSLQIKWQTEMQEKFGLEFRIVDSQYIKNLRRERGIHANPWTSFPRLIASMDWIKSGEGLRYLKDVIPLQISYPRRFDILVVDEAHNIAPSGSAHYAMPSLRTQIIQRISPHFNHHLFLSATPHNGYQESFTSLLELLDNQRFAKTVMPNEQQLQQIMIRRLKDNITDKNGNRVFPIRELKALEVNYTQEESEIHLLLKRFTESRLKSVEGTKLAFATKFVHILLKKRLFSSPAAFAKTLSKYQETLANGFIRSDKKDNYKNEKILHRILAKTEEEFADEELAEEAAENVIELEAEMSVNLSIEQRSMLDRLSAWANKNQNYTDSKAKAILTWLREHLKPDGKWNDKRVVLFTEYRDTHSWLNSILAHNGFGESNRLMIIHGGSTSEEREEVKAAFQTSPDISPVRILLATDAASEGIDLQNYCNYMIHIEIPWNPNVMEQRNGRIDRHGQKEKSVCIWHPVGKGFVINNTSAKPGDIVGDQEYLMRAALKINTIREDLGSVGLVLEKQIEDAMLGRNSILDTTMAESKRKISRKLIQAEKDLQTKIARLHENLLKATDTFHLAPKNIENAVKVALDIAEKPALRATRISGVNEDVWEVPNLSGSWALALNGLNHPHTGKKRPITFDNSVIKGREDVVLAHLNHKLVQMSLRLLREEIWQLEDVKHLNRVSIKSMAGIDAPRILVWSRLVITGGDHHRLHEELTLSGGTLDNMVYHRITTQSELENCVEKSTDKDQISDVAFNELKTYFIKFEKSIMSSVEARSKDRLISLNNSIGKRKESEIKDITQILDDLKANIEKELHVEEPKVVQLTFNFDEAEKNQLKKDTDALRARLEKIPEEKKSEIALIEKHYAMPQARTFPVAVIFVVPQTAYWGGKC